MTSPTTKLEAFLTAAKVSGSFTKMNIGPGIVFTPRGDRLQLVPQSDQVWKDYEDELLAHYPTDGAVGGHLTRIANAGKAVYAKYDRAGETFIGKRYPLVALPTTTNNLKRVLYALGSAIREARIPRPDAGDVGYGQMAEWFDNMVESLDGTVATYSVLKNASGADVTASATASFFYSTGTTTGTASVYHSALERPRPGYFMVSFCDVRNTSGQFSRGPLRVGMIPVSEDETCVGYHIQRFEFGANGATPKHYLEGSNCVKVMVSTLDVNKASFAGYQMGGSNPGFAMTRNVVMGTMPGEVALKAMTEVQPITEAQLQAVGALHGHVVDENHATALTYPVDVSARIDALATIAGVSRAVLVRDLWQYSGWLEVGRDYACNHVIEALLIRADITAPAVAAFATKIKFGRLADVIEIGYAGSITASLRGIISQFRMTPDAEFHAAVKIGEVVRPPRDALYRTELYRAALEAGEDVRQQAMLDKDPDDVQSERVTFAQANSRVNKMYDSPRSAYLASVESERRSISGQLLIGHNGLGFQFYDGNGVLMSPDDAYLIVATAPVEKLLFKTEAMAALNLIATPPGTFPYDIKFEKMCLATWSKSYGAITVVTAEVGAGSVLWAAPIKSGFITEPETWTPEFWLRLAAGKAQQAMSLVGSILTNPTGVGTALSPDGKSTVFLTL